MRTMRQNKQKLFYATLQGETTEYVYDVAGNKVIDFVEGGVTYYKQTGATILSYNTPVEFCANIAFSGGETQAVEFGVDTSSYDATLVYLLNEFPITETTLIWYKTTPVINNGIVDPASADYKVLSVKPSLNFTKVLLGRLVK